MGYPGRRTSSGNAGGQQGCAFKGIPQDLSAMNPCDRGALSGQPGAMPFKLEQVTLSDTLTECLTPVEELPHSCAHAGLTPGTECRSGGRVCGHGADTRPEATPEAAPGFLRKPPLTCIFT